MKKIISVVSTLFMLSLCFASIAAANPGSTIQQGSQEIGGQISLEGSESKTDGSNTTSKSSTGTLSLSYGYFLTDGLQLAGRFMEMSNTSGSDSGMTFDYLYLEGKYHFYSKGQTLIPYIGAGLGAAASIYKSQGTTTKSTGTSASLMGGAKYFVSEKTSINSELNFSSSKFEKTTTSATRLLVGFSIYF